MRMTSFLAGLAVAVAACGGEQAADQPAADAADTATTGAAAAPVTGTGTTHDVNMTLDGTEYRFEPSELTVQPGDVIRFHNVSGGPHNVSFWPDSIPSGAQEILASGMGETMGPLQGALLVEPNAVYTVTFGEDIPTGEYPFYCTPHLAMGMTGTITVQE